ncbi:uncharacterized protein [Watersipora subatra]|uniref:uncharacterized protein n=1 Tax=Watersipora subatra TaxID=2589382 RepID=UPI00355BA951
MTHISDNEFMNVIRSYRAVYVRTSKEFKNIAIKENAWKAIGAQVDMVPVAARKRYENIRTKLARYLKAQVLAKSDSDREDVPINKELESLRWLSEYIQHRNKRGANLLDDEASSTEEDTASFDDFVDTNTNPTTITAAIKTETATPVPLTLVNNTKNRGRMPVDRTSHQRLETTDAWRKDDDDDECGSFCRLLAAKMRKLDYATQGIVQHRMLGVFLDIHSGQSHQSSLSSVTSSSLLSSTQPSQSITSQPPQSSHSSSQVPHSSASDQPSPHSPTYSLPEIKIVKVASVPSLQ